MYFTLSLVCVLIYRFAVIIARAKSGGVNAMAEHCEAPKNDFDQNKWERIIIRANVCIFRAAVFFLLFFISFYFIHFIFRFGNLNKWLVFFFVSVSDVCAYFFLFASFIRMNSSHTLCSELIFLLLQCIRFGARYIFFIIITPCGFFLSKNFIIFFGGAVQRRKKSL